MNRPVLFRGKKPERVAQELYGLQIASNLVRKITQDAAGTVEVEPTRLGFTDSLSRTARPSGVGRPPGCPQCISRPPVTLIAWPVM